MTHKVTINPGPNEFNVGEGDPVVVSGSAGRTTGRVAKIHKTFVNVEIDSLRLIKSFMIRTGECWGNDGRLSEFIPAVEAALEDAAKQRVAHAKAYEARLAAAGDVIAVGSNLHLLEMAVEAFENTAKNRLGESPSAKVVPLRLPDPDQASKIPVRLRGWATYRMASNPCELIAAELWAKANAREFDGIFDYLCGNGNKPGNPSERDWAVANSLMQWLGSPVGRNYVRDLAAAFQAEESRRSHDARADR